MQATTASMARQRGLMRPLMALALATLALASSAGTAPARTTYRIIPLSPTGGNADINARGQVAFTELIADTPRAKFYDGHVVRDLGTLGGAGALIAALNEAGQVAGTSSTGTTDHAFRWSKQTGMIDLAAPGTGPSFATDINNKGWVTGGAVFPGQPGSHGFRWTPRTGMVDLGAVNMSSIAYALNDSGTVVGEAVAVGSTNSVAVMWPGGRPGPVLLTTSPTPASAARDINNAGQIVGNGAPAPGFADIPFLWSPSTGLVDLNISPPVAPTQINEKGVVIGAPLLIQESRGFVWTRATGGIIFGAEGEVTSADDLNNRGQVVGGFNGRAFVWTQAEGVVDLNTRIPSAPPGLVLTRGIAISDNGTIVAASNTGRVLLVPGRSGHHEAPLPAPIKLTGAPRVGALLSFSAAFRDADLRDTHKATWSWGDGSHSVGTVSTSRGAGNVSGQHAWRKAGTYTVRLTLADSGGKRSTVQRTVVVSASGAYVSGEGSFLSPADAYKGGASRPALASFVFASEAAGARQAQGEALIRFHVGNLAFHSSRYDTLTVDGGRVQYGGTGSVNGRDGYRFLLSASAGAKSGGMDRFRIRISHMEPGAKAEVVDYDNGVGSEGSVVAAEGAIEVVTQ